MNSPAPSDHGVAWRFLKQSLAHRGSVVGLLLLATLAIAGIINPAFLAPANLADVLSAASAPVIIACGVACVVLCGEIDISVGALYGLLAALMGTLSSPTHANLPTPLVVVIILAVGVVCGLFNGLLVTRGKVPSIIVTLGMMTVLRGTTELLLNGVWITDLPLSLRTLGTMHVLGIPLSVVAAALAVGGALWLTRRTPLGLRFYAVGSSSDAARLAGIHVAKVKTASFAMTGFLTALAALVTVPQLSVVEPGLGVGLELVVITAVVVGGVSIRGGVGTITGVTLAALLLGAVRTVLIFAKLGPAAAFWERAVYGVFIISAVIVDRLARSQATPRPPVTDRDAGTTGARISHNAVLLFLLLALLATAALISPSFATIHTQLSLLPQSAELLLLAVPMTLVLLTGGIDLSIGATMALASVAAGLVFEHGMSPWTAAGCGLTVGCACGLSNGVLIARAKMDPLIVTLATMSLFRGLAEGISAARPVSGFPDSFTVIGTGVWLGVPLVLLPAAVAYGLAGFLDRFSVFARNVRAVGFNEAASRFSGIAVDRLKLWIYLASGATAGLAGMLLVARRNTAKADAGLGVELDVITAVILGGTSVAGGRGSILGTLLGVLLLHELRQFIAWNRYHDESIQIVIGIVLIASVLAGRLSMFRRSTLARA